MRCGDARCGELRCKHSGCADVNSGVSAAGWQLAVIFALGSHQHHQCHASLLSGGQHSLDSLFTSVPHMAATWDLRALLGEVL